MSDQPKPTDAGINDDPMLPHRKVAEANLPTQPKPRKEDAASPAGGRTKLCLLGDYDESCPHCKPATDPTPYRVIESGTRPFKPATGEWTAGMLKELYDDNEWIDDFFAKVAAAHNAALAEKEKVTEIVELLSTAIRCGRGLGSEWQARAKAAIGQPQDRNPLKLPTSYRKFMEGK